MRRATVGSLYKWTFDDDMPDPAHPTHRATSLAPTWNGPVGAGTRKEIAPGEAAVAAFRSNAALESGTRMRCEDIVETSSALDSEGRADERGDRVARHR